MVKLQPSEVVPAPRIQVRMLYAQELFKKIEVIKHYREVLAVLISVFCGNGFAVKANLTFSRFIESHQQFC